LVPRRNRSPGRESDEAAQLEHVDSREKLKPTYHVVRGTRQVVQINNALDVSVDLDIDLKHGAGIYRREGNRS